MEGFALIKVLRLLTGRLEPNTGPLFMRLQLDSGDLGEDSPEVRVKRGIGLQMRFFAELQLCPHLARFVFEVTETVHTFSSYNFSKAMTAKDLEDAYDKCIEYYCQFTDSFASDMDSTFDLLFAQIRYHYCPLSLLRPLVKSTASLVDGATPRLRNNITPRLVYQQSSEAVIFLAGTYQTRYSPKHLPPQVSHALYGTQLSNFILASPAALSDAQYAVAAGSKAPGFRLINGIDVRFNQQ